MRCSGVTSCSRTPANFCYLDGARGRTSRMWAKEPAGVAWARIPKQPLSGGAAQRRGLSGTRGGLFNLDASDAVLGRTRVRASAATTPSAGDMLPALTEDDRTRAQLWLAAAKPPMYTVAIAPVVVGAALAKVQAARAAAPACVALCKRSLRGRWPALPHRRGCAAVVYDIFNPPVRRRA